VLGNWELLPGLSRLLRRASGSGCTQIPASPVLDANRASANSMSVNERLGDVSEAGRGFPRPKWWTLHLYALRTCTDGSRIYRVKDAGNHGSGFGCPATADQRQGGADDIIAEMGTLMVDAVLAAHRLAADHRGTWTVANEYPDVRPGEIAEALVFIFADGLKQPFDVNRLREVVMLYLGHPPGRWIEAISDPTVK